MILYAGMKTTFSTQSFIVGLLFGALLTGAWFYGNGGVAQPLAARALSAATTTAATTTETGSLGATTSSTGSASDAVSVSDQPAGQSVQIESVTVPPPGVWVAVREVNAGSLSNVLGAERASGPRSNFSVPLLRATEPGRTYAVELYRGGAGAFSLATDSVYVDFASGKPVIAYFNTVD